MSVEIDTPTARFARRSTRGVLLGLTAWRLTALGTATACVLAGLVSGAGGVGLLIGLVLAAPLIVVAFARVGGRPAVEWTGDAGVFAFRRATGQTVYSARLDKPRPAGTMALPGDAAGLRFHVDRTSGVCMVHDPHRQTLAVVIQVAHPAYVLLSPGQQAQRVSAYGRLLAGLAPSATCACIQIVEASIPDSGRPIGEWYATHGTHQGGWVDDQYKELLATSSVCSSTHRSTVTLALDMKAASRAIRAAGGGMAGAARVLRGDMASLEHGLRAAELTFGGWMGEAQVAAVVRAAYDPGLGADFGPHSPGANLNRAGPLAISERWDKLRHDSGFSQVLWISEWPRTAQPAHFLHSLIFTPGVRKSLSLTMRPKPAGAALREIRRQKTDWIADSNHKAKVGQLADFSDAQEWNDLLARERALVNGHADVDFTGLLVVTATSEDELDAAARQVERAASQVGCETRVLFGRQAQGFVAALPIGRSTL